LGINQNDYDCGYNYFKLYSKIDYKLKDYKLKDYKLKDYKLKDYKLKDYKLKDYKLKDRLYFTPARMVEWRDQY